MKRLSLLPLLFVVATTTLPAQTMYLKLDGVTVPGSSGVHTDELKVSSFETNQTSPTSVVSLSLSASKVAFSNLKLTTAFNPIVNAVLSARQAMGTRLATGELRFYDGANVITSKFEMGDLFVTALKTNGADGDAVQEIDLAFSRIRWWATPPGAPLRMISGWDIVKNAAW